MDVVRGRLARLVQRPGAGFAAFQVLAQRRGLTLFPGLRIVGHSTFP